MNILFITYNRESTASCRFRSYFPANAINNLKDSNVTAKVKLVYFVTYDDINHADVVVFQRIPQALWYLKRLKLPLKSLLRSRIVHIFEYSLKYGKRVCVDIDDLIFLDENEYRTGVDEDFLPELIKQCHQVIVSTPNLADRVKLISQNVAIIRNALDFKWMQSNCANPILKQINAWKKEGVLVVGWVCGNAQREDFELFRTIHLSILNKSDSPQIQFLLIGGNNYLSQFGARMNCVTTTPAVHWKQLPKIQSQLDANLSILANTRFNRCKSELKIIEPGFFGVPSICSNVGVASQLIQHGLNGFLATTPKEWVSSIQQALAPNVRKTVGHTINGQVLREYDLRNRAGEYLRLLSSHDA